MLFCAGESGIGSAIALSDANTADFWFVGPVLKVPARDRPKICCDDPMED
ncbi:MULTISPECIES: hypothetical protein [unclassified Microcoleus]